MDSLASSDGQDASPRGWLTEFDRLCRLSVEYRAMRRRPGKSTGAMSIFKIMELPETWWQRSCQRRSLATLDDNLLKDIGLSGADAWREANKPFWKP